MSIESRYLQRDGISFFERVVKQHDCVMEIVFEDKDAYKAIATIRRYSPLSTVRVYIADVYILTANDVIEILDKNFDINCIVVISNWDHYTGMAKANAKMQGVGVFTLNQFLKALNYDGRRFLDTGIANATEENA